MQSGELEKTAASLLSTWTDSDTAMQIIGMSLGLLGPDLLDPADVLSYETPLRNALFDVLLSLVEGGALDLRPTEDAGYAFRWRADWAVAALTPGSSSAVDVDAPSPYLAELIQARRERDDALGRADFAEALAAERERLLRVADTPRAKRPARRRVESPAAPAKPPVVIEVPDAPPAETPEPLAAPVAIAPVAIEPVAIEPVAIEPVAITPVNAAPVSEPTAVEPGEPAPVKPVARKKAAPKKAVPKKAVPKKPAAKKPRKKAAPKPAVAPARGPDAPVAVEEPVIDLTDETDEKPSQVVYLPAPAPVIDADDMDIDDGDLDDDLFDLADDASAARAKWSGYTLDKPRSHLSSVDRIADEG